MSIADVFTIDTNTVLPMQIHSATPTSAGVMSAADKAKLDGLPEPIGAFQRTVVQPADGSDFFVSLPAALVQTTANYSVAMTIVSGSIMTTFTIPFASQTNAAFRVVTDAQFDNGTLLNFIVMPF